MLIRKSFHILLAIAMSLLFGACAANASTLSDAAESLSAGESIKITTTDLATVNQQDGNTLTMWGNTGSWDSINQKIYFIGKRNSSNPHRMMVYTESTNTWTTDNSIHASLTSNQSGHAYDGNAIDPATGDIYFRRYEDSGHCDDTVFKWTRSTDTWSILANTSNRIHCCEALEWWPGRGLVFSDVYSVEIYGGSSWSEIIDDDGTLSGIGYHSFGEVQPTADIYVFGGGNDGSTKLYRLEADNTLTTLGAAPFGLGNHETSQGILVYDPGSSYYIAWDQADAWRQFDGANDSWSVLTECSGDGSTACTGTPNLTEQTSVAVPISTYGVIAFFGGSSNDVWLYKHSDTEGTNTGSILQSFSIKPAATNADTPFTVGLAFKEGDTTGPTLDITDVADYQLEVKKSWNDGSVKHAIASGRANLTASSAKSIDVYSAGTQPSGADLTEASIVTAAPTATVAFSGQSWTTVSLASLLGSPDRTFISGPEMVEAHYSQDVAEQDEVVVKFYVRLYANDDMWVRVVIENGILDGADGADYTYTPTVTIGGSTAYNTQVVHENNTRWTVHGWINTTDPDITIDHDCDYIETTGLVPTYWKETPSSGTLDGLTQTYTPMAQGGWTTDMGDTGHQNQIGLLPIWDALYLNSDGDERAFASVIANAKALNSYPIIWRDPTTDYPIVLSSWSTWTVSGAGQGGATARTAGSLTWDVAHHGSGGYLAYLITGDYYYLETMEHQAATCYLFVTPAYYGNGTSRAIVPVQTRGIAWSNRTIGQLAAIGPSDSIVDDFVTVIGSTADYWNTKRLLPGANTIGYLYSYEVEQGDYALGETAPWQQHFWVATYGYLSDMQPLSSMTNLNLVRDYLYTSVVGILGPTGTDNYCFTKASLYNTLKICDSASSDITAYYSNWGGTNTTTDEGVYYETHGSSNTSCGNTLEGGSGGDPANADEGYWGNLLPAIAYARSDGATGAAAAWARLTGATNWSDVENAGFDDNPIWGIVLAAEEEPTAKVLMITSQ